MGKRVFAIHAHPDDIEFMMAGTMILLKDAGCELYYMTVANGSAGSAEYNREEIIKIREAESMKAAQYLGATYISSITDDLCIFYDRSLIEKVSAIIRMVKPDILLVPSPQDYMEDHVNTGRIAVTAAFTKGMKNYECDPPTACIDTDVTIYHAQPHYSRDALRKVIQPDFFVDVSSVMKAKQDALRCHASQKNWLDVSQGFDSYIETMNQMMGELGAMSKKFSYAEGWRRHSHIGFSTKEIDPIRELLEGKLVVDNN